MEIREVLLVISAGDEREAEEAFTWLYHNAWEEILGVLKSKRMVCGLTLEQKEIAVTDAFVELWRKARAGEIEDTEKDPRALLHHIALRRGVDLVRKNTAKRRSMTTDEWSAFVKDTLQKASFSAQWSLLQNKGLADGVGAEFISWVQDQKGVCHRTALAMVEFLPDLASPKELHELLSEQVDPPPTRESVKKARAEVLTKFRQAIELKYKGMWK